MGWTRRQQLRALAGFGLVLLAAVAVAAVAFAAAGGGDEVDDVALDDPGERRGPTTSGRSTTVSVTTAVPLLPLAHRVAEVVGRPPGVSVDVRTPGGDAPVTALCSGHADVSLTARRLRPGERRGCRRNGLRPTARRIGYQAVAVYTSHGLGIDCLTLRELRSLFRPGSDIDRYSQVDPGLPELPVRLFSPASGESGSRLFTRTVIGTAGAIRRDVRAVRDTPDFGRILEDAPAGLGVYGAGLRDFEDLALDTVALDHGAGCVAPRPAAVRSGRYPLSEPVYAYTTMSALRREPVARYFDTLTERAPELADYPGIVPPRRNGEGG